MLKPKLAIAAVSGSCFQFDWSGPSNGFSILRSADTYGPVLGSGAVPIPIDYLGTCRGRCGQVEDASIVTGAGHCYGSVCYKCPENWAKKLLVHYNRWYLFEK